MAFRYEALLDGADAAQGGPGVAGRLELEHIEEMIETMRVKPDFGFDVFRDEEDEHAAGW